MSISSVSNQSQSLYQQLQTAQSFKASSPGTRTPGQTTAGGDGDNDGSTGAASVLNAALGQFIDSYA